MGSHIRLDRSWMLVRLVSSNFCGLEGVEVLTLLFRVLPVLFVDSWLIFELLIALKVAIAAKPRPIEGRTNVHAFDGVLLRLLRVAAFQPCVLIFVMHLTQWSIINLINDIQIVSINCIDQLFQRRGHSVHLQRMTHNSYYLEEIAFADFIVIIQWTAENEGSAQGKRNQQPCKICGLVDSPSQLISFQKESLFSKAPPLAPGVQRRTPHCPSVPPRAPPSQIRR